MASKNFTTSFEHENKSKANVKYFREGISDWLEVKEKSGHNIKEIKQELVQLTKKAKSVEELNVILKNRLKEVMQNKDLLYEFNGVFIQPAN